MLRNLPISNLKSLLTLAAREQICINCSLALSGILLLMVSGVFSISDVSAKQIDGAEKSPAILKNTADAKNAVPKSVNPKNIETSSNSAHSSSSTQKADFLYNKFLNEGCSLMQMRHYDDAIIKFTEASKVRPGSAHPICLRARAYVHMKRDADAFRDLDLAKKIEPGSIQPNLTYATLELRKQNVAGARAVINKGLKIQPDNTELIGLMGHTYAVEKNYPEALKYVNRLIKINPKNAHSLWMRAGIYRSMQDLPK